LNKLIDGNVVPGLTKVLIQEHVAPGEITHRRKES